MIERTLSRFFLQAATHFPVMLLTGAKQVGKTTLLKHLCETEGRGRRYVTLDDPLVMEGAKKDPALFAQKYGTPLLIDEIQYAPELLPYIKMAVDENRTPGAFWLTGSQQFHLMKNISETLAGRVCILNLLGLSQAEIRGEAGRPPFMPESREPLPGVAGKGVMELFHTIWKGSFPEAVSADDTLRGAFFGSYVQTYLQRDVRDLTNVGNELAFLAFLRGAAARTGNILNLTDLARDADITPNTAKNWLSILEASGIVYLLQPYHSNVTKRLVKSPKLYFLDTGLAAWLTGWSSPEPLESGAMAGASFETWLLGEILKSWWHNGQEAPFFFFRNSDGVEIDLLIVQDGTIHPVEFKKTASPRRDAVRHFSSLETYTDLKIGEGALLCLVGTPLPLAGNITALPASYL